jgi:hypothetical protein
MTIEQGPIGGSSAEVGEPTERPTNAAQPGAPPPGPAPADDPLLAAVELVNSGELQQFFAVLFCHADPESFVSLRAFYEHDRSKPAFLIQGVKVGDPQLIEKIGKAALAAARAVSSAVFAPPVATLNNRTHARYTDLANGIAITCDLDNGDTYKKLQQLEHYLGPATIVIRSGGVWVDPETGERLPKLHVHWRLSQPTRDLSSHNLLTVARRDAALLVGADGTGSSPVHPFRWPGSVHQGSGAPGSLQDRAHQRAG